MKHIPILLIVLSLLLAGCGGDDDRDKDLTGVTIDNTQCTNNACTGVNDVPNPIVEVDVDDGQGGVSYLHIDNTESGRQYEVQPQNVCIVNCGDYMEVHPLPTPTNTQ